MGRMMLFSAALGFCAAFGGDYLVIDCHSPYKAAQYASAADLPRGVLTEDGVWDLLTDERELAALMSEYAAEFIRRGTSA